MQHQQNSRLTHSFLTKCSFQIQSGCPAPRLLRCFCSCSELTVDEVKRYSTMNVAALLGDSKAKQLFVTFLSMGHRTDESGAMTALRCYDLCDRLLNISANRTNDEYDNLRDVCPSFAWEQRLDAAIDQCDEDALRTFFASLMFETKRTIELHRDYGRFKEALLNKLEQ